MEDHHLVSLIPMGECFHTLCRGINTYEELVEMVDQHPQFMERLAESLAERQKHIGEGYT